MTAHGGERGARIAEPPMSVAGTAIQAYRHYRADGVLVEPASIAARTTFARWVTAAVSATAGVAIAAAVDEPNHSTAAAPNAGPRASADGVDEHDQAVVAAVLTTDTI